MKNISEQKFQQNSWKIFIVILCCISIHLCRTEKWDWEAEVDGLHNKRRQKTERGGEKEEWRDGRTEGKTGRVSAEDGWDGGGLEEEDEGRRDQEEEAGGGRKRGEFGKRMYRLPPPPKKKKKKKKKTIGLPASITFKIVNKSKYALGL